MKNNKIIIIIISFFILALLFLLFILFNNKKDDIKIVNNKCDFELLDIKISKYHKDGPDLNKVKELEEELKKPCVDDGVGFNWCEMSSTKRELYWEKNSKDKLTWVEVEGIIKLNGNKSQNIDSIISKIYTNDDKKIFLGDGYININEDITPGTSYPFKLSVTIDRNKELVGKYFSKDDEIKVDTYPYFSSCAY